VGLTWLFHWLGTLDIIGLERDIALTTVSIGRNKVSHVQFLPGTNRKCSYMFRVQRGQGLGRLRGHFRVGFEVMISSHGDPEFLSNL
jgi:hypothetical protein